MFIIANFWLRQLAGCKCNCDQAIAKMNEAVFVSRQNTENPIKVTVAWKVEV
jgi:hypothetical protein